MTKRMIALALAVCMLFTMAAFTPVSANDSAADESAVTYCGLEEHIHAYECFERELVCGVDLDHKHSDACKEKTWLCGFTQDFHEHNSGCSFEEKLICGVDLDTPHTHGEACYARKTTCGLVESDGHVHTTEANCFDANGNVVCTQQTEAHKHTVDCFNLECTETEHKHIESCYKAPGVLNNLLNNLTASGDEQRDGESPSPTEDNGSTDGNTDNDGSSPIVGDADPASRPCTCDAAEGEDHAEDCALNAALVVEDDADYPPAINTAVNFTNAAPPMSFASRSMTTFANSLMSAFSAMPMMMSLEEDESSSGDNTSISAPVIVDKYVTNHTDGTSTLTMESYATGKTVTTQTYKEKPTDIVLVLDMSTSMAYCSTVCGRSLDMKDKNYTYGCRWNGSSTYHFAIHSPDTTNLYNYRTHPLWADRVNTKYYARCDHTGVNREYLFESVYYCQSCTDVTTDDDGKVRGIWHYDADKTSSNPHSRWFIPAKDSETGAYRFLLEKETILSLRCVSRYEMMYNAVVAFVNDVYDRAKGPDGEAGTEDDIDHRISFVYFVEEANLVAPLTPVIDSNGALSSTIQTAVDYYTFGNWTGIGAGVKKATEQVKSAYESLSDPTQRSRIIVAMTDGVPDVNNDHVSTAKVAFEEAYKAINSYSSSVYTVGIFNGANSSNPSSISNANLANLNAGLTSDTDKAQANSFMHLLSSNYPYMDKYESWQNRNSTAMTLNPELKEGQSYYLSAKDSDGLKNAFLQIAAGVGSESVKSDLDSHTIVRDVVTPYFDVIPGSRVTAYTLDFLGEDENTKVKNWSTEKNSETNLTAASGASVAEPLTIKMVDERTVEVTGFDFGANYVGMDEHVDNGVTTTKAHGKKLVIEINIKPNDSFLGGNNVPTNDVLSGVYPDTNGDGTADTSVPSNPFPVPDTDVEVKDDEAIDVTIDVQAGSTYLDQLPYSELLKLVRLKAGQFTLDLTKENFGLEDWQTEFVNIKVALYDTETDEDGNQKYDENNKPIMTGQALTEGSTLSYRRDHQVGVQVWIWPKTNSEGAAYDTDPTKVPANVMNTDTAFVAIEVHYPTFVFADETMYYGENFDTKLEKWEKMTANQYLHWYTDAEYDLLVTNENETGKFTVDQIKQPNFAPMDETDHFVGTEPTIWLRVDPIDEMVPAENKTGSSVDNTFYEKYGNYMLKRDVSMNVRVYFGNKEGADFTQPLRHAFFLHAIGEAGANAECANLAIHTSGGLVVDENNMPDPDYLTEYWTPEFYIHPKTCQLTITKTGGIAGETYLFKIKTDAAVVKDANGWENVEGMVDYTTVSITADANGNGSVTVYELPVGNYEVTEDTNWSWRFKGSAPAVTWSRGEGTTVTNGSTVALIGNANEDHATVAFTNSNPTNKWLSGMDIALPNVYGKKHD